MKIDIFPHIFPKAYFDKMVEVIPNKDTIRRWTNIPVLFDLDARLRMMERWPDYQQILTLSMPAIEFVAPAERSPELARLANDGMAEICAKYPKQFPGWVASVPMNNVKASIVEIERAVEKLGARGIQIFTNVSGRPLDDPEFAPIFARLHDYDLPIWMHPTRPHTHSDYKSEDKSKFDIWWVFGWPYETSAAMARMVFSGFFDRWPNLKIITHHLGAMVPYSRGAGRARPRPARQARRRRAGLCRDRQGDEGEGQTARSIISANSTATPRSTVRSRARGAASISSAASMCCSAPTARSIPKAGRCSSATSSRCWTRWNSATAIAN